jgi:hypothetical protein
MKLFVTSIVALASLGAIAGAQETHKIRPHRFTHEEKSAKSSVPIRTSKADDALSRELKQAEQGAKLGAVKSTARTRRVAAAPKARTEKPTPPIHFGSAASAGHATSSNQGSNPYRGRLKQKHGGK